METVAMGLADVPKTESCPEKSLDVVGLKFKAIVCEPPAAMWIGYFTELARAKLCPATLICWISTGSAPSFTSAMLVLARSPMVTVPKSTVPGETRRTLPNPPPLTEKPQPEIRVLTLIVKRRRIKT